MIRVGGLSSLGLSLPSLLASQADASSEISDPTFGRAKSVIYVWLQGGPPQHETFDPKPEAPSGIRGLFSPIQTNVPGVQFCELLPRTARIADKLAIVRSMATDNNQHSGSGSVSGATTGIWNRWSMSQTESKPSSRRPACMVSPWGSLTVGFRVI